MGARNLGNITLRDPNLTEEGRVATELFAQDLLDVGNGTAPRVLGGPHAANWHTGCRKEEDETIPDLIEAVHNVLDVHILGSEHTGKRYFIPMAIGKGLRYKIIRS